MKKKINKKSIASAIAIALGVTGVTTKAGALDGDTLFGLKEISSSTHLIAQEGSCGEGKCGEGKCGEGMCGGKKGGDKPNIFKKVVKYGKTTYVQDKSGKYKMISEDGKVKYVLIKKDEE